MIVLNDLKLYFPFAMSYHEFTTVDTLYIPQNNDCPVCIYTQLLGSLKYFWKLLILPNEFESSGQGCVISVIK
jgi:hypothetical protein